MQNVKKINCLTILLSCLLTLPCFAGDPNEPKDLLDMELAELLDIQVVTSASRQKHKITESSAAITVVTAEDIHYSGLTNIEDILRFYAGMDVLRINQNLSAVGVRGFHDFLSDRTLTLINGRPADSPIFGGSEFYRYPVLIEDIERIEIIRGPGGAAWGANAFNGIINIITKKPGSDPGWLSSSTANEYGGTYNYLRWMSKKESPLAARLSVGYDSRGTSDEDGAGKMVTYKPSLAPLTGFNSYKAHDFTRNFRVDTEFSYDISEKTILSFGLAYSHLERGDYESLGYFPRETAWYETSRNFAKIEYVFDKTSNLYVQWTGNFNSSKQPSICKRHTSENDIEVQYNTSFDRHSLSMGGNTKFMYIDTEMVSVESLNPIGDPFHEMTIGAFVIDRFEINERLALEGQLRTDWYSGTQQDWATRLSALYTCDDDRNHNLRFSFAKAFRTPLTSLGNNRSTRLFHPGLSAYLLNVNTPPDTLYNEETWALEAGYNSRLPHGISFKADAYYQKYSRLIGYENNGAVPTVFTADNIDGAASWGVETELAIENKTGIFSVWYAYNDFQEDISHQLIRSYAPAKHKSGLRAILPIAEGLTLVTNYRFTSTTPVIGDTTIFPVAPSHRLDITLTKSICKGNGELMFGVSDLLEVDNDAVYGVGSLSSYTTPGRTFLGRIQIRF